jgi:hypothetical protein
MNDELFYDYLDELLEPEDAQKAEAAIARDPARFAEIARRRATLYRPYAVAAPRARNTGLLRYAAVFLLGVLVPTLISLAPKPHDPKPEPAPPVEITNRRLR